MSNISLLQDGWFDLISSSECFIFIAVSVDTHIEVILGHMAIWPYGHRAEIWSYGQIAIWLYGNGGQQYRCFWKQQYKCSNLTKEFPKNTKENMPSDHFCSHF